MKQYYILIQGVQSGPYTDATIVDKISSGEISRENLCWTEGMKDWMPIHVVVLLPSSTPPPPPASPTAPPPFYPPTAHAAINWIPALVFYCIVSALSFLIDLIELGGDSSASEALALIALPLTILGVVFISLLHYKCWASLPERFRFTTPAKAVGYLFIPFYNFYWAFITWPKLSEGVNSWQKSKGMNALPDTQSFALAYAILFVCAWTIGFLPFPGFSLMLGIGDLAIFIIYYKQVVTSINQLVSK